MNEQNMQMQSRGAVLEGSRNVMAELYLTETQFIARKRTYTPWGILAGIAVAGVFFYLGWGLRGPGVLAYAPGALLGSLGGALGFLACFFLTAIKKGDEGILFALDLAHVTSLCEEKVKNASYQVIQCGQQPQRKVSMKKEMSAAFAARIQ